MKTASIVLRLVSKRDHEKIAFIDRWCFTDAWDTEQITEYRLATDTNGIVAECPDSRDVFGFCLYSLSRSRIQIDRLAVAPEQQRQGVGAAIIDRMISKISNQRRKVIDIGVELSRVGPLEFLRRQGFRPVGMLSGDVVHMRYATDPDLTVWSRRD